MDGLDPSGRRGRLQLPDSPTESPVEPALNEREPTDTAGPSVFEQDAQLEQVSDGEPGAIAEPVVETNPSTDETQLVEVVQVAQPIAVPIETPTPVAVLTAPPEAPTSGPALPEAPGQLPLLAPPTISPVLTLRHSVPPPPAPRQDRGSDAAAWLADACPYLRSADGTWRSAVPRRGQRCWGQSPPAELEPATQLRLCRTDAHVRCEIFLAADARRAESLARDHLTPERLDGRFGVTVRPVPLVIDAPAVRSAGGVVRARRTRIGLGLAIAIAVVAVALLAGMGPSLPSATPGNSPIAFVSPSPGISPSAVVAATPTPAVTGSVPTPSATPVAPTQTPVASPSPPPTTGPTPTPTAIAYRQYRVRRGDSLKIIAAKFGTTPRAIRAANDLGKPARLFYGQIINIPPA